MSYLIRAHILAVAVLLFIPALSSAKAAELTVTDGWMRALPTGLPAGGYFVLHNNGDKAMTLTGASSPACGMLMLHKSESMDGMSQMNDVSTINVVPHGTLSFSPGGYHLMCMDAKPELKAGGKVQVTLQFADGTAVSSEFAVRNAAGH